MIPIKVNIDKTIEISDAQRKEIAAVLDGPGGKKRDATRDEMKDFLWAHGARWEAVLAGDDEGQPEVEDLLGDADDDLLGDVDDEDLI